MSRQELEGCERFFLGVKHEDGEAIRYRVFHARCHSWSCPVCAKIKARQYKERMQPLFESRQLFMYTLTYFHAKLPIEVWSELSIAWNRFRTAATKRFGSFSYVRVLEHHHKSPYPHLHIIADKEFPATWLNKELLSAGFGYQAKVVKVTSVGAAFYISKYLTKPWTDEACKEMRKNLRLRIISFGGSACLRAMAGTPWELVTKCFVCQDAIDSIMVDLEWKHGQNWKKTYEKEFDGNIEYTFYIKQGGFGGGGTM